MELGSWAQWTLLVYSKCWCSCDCQGYNILPSPTPAHSDTSIAITLLLIFQSNCDQHFVDELILHLLSSTCQNWVMASSLQNPVVCQMDTWRQTFWKTTRHKASHRDPAGLPALDQSTDCKQTCQQCASTGSSSTHWSKNTSVISYHQKGQYLKRQNEGAKFWRLRTLTHVVGWVWEIRSFTHYIRKQAFKDRGSRAAKFNPNLALK